MVPWTLMRSRIPGVVARTMVPGTKRGFLRAVPGYHDHQDTVLSASKHSNSKPSSRARQTGSWWFCGERDPLFLTHSLRWLPRPSTLRTGFLQRPGDLSPSSLTFLPSYFTHSGRRSYRSTCRCGSASKRQVGLLLTVCISASPDFATDCIL
jgi:hypothetical protein